MQFVLTILTAMKYSWIYLKDYLFYAHVINTSYAL